MMGSPLRVTLGSIGAVLVLGCMDSCGPQGRGARVSPHCTATHVSPSLPDPALHRARRILAEILSFAAAVPVMWCMDGCGGAGEGAGSRLRMRIRAALSRRGYVTIFMRAGLTRAPPPPIPTAPSGVSCFLQFLSVYLRSRPHPRLARATASEWGVCADANGRRDARPRVAWSMLLHPARPFFLRRCVSPVGEMLLLGLYVQDEETRRGTFGSVLDTFVAAVAAGDVLPYLFIVLGAVRALRLP
ncbi:hypothetical protein C8R44DRAFT_986810 [Mycena epipterygia]|nr:hypothetical protein C8R44DRAFT_986810 [Mycena epipterygia]